MSADAARPPLTLTALGDLLAEPDDAPEWLVENRIPCGALVILAGKPKAGRSTLARDLAFAVATGSPWLGWPTLCGTVWYLALEEKRSEVRKHFRLMGATGDEPIRLLINQMPDRAIDALRELAEREAPFLIVVDTLQRLLKVRDLNDYSAVTAALDPLIRLSRATGATLLLLHHAGKGDREGIDALLGSTALAGSVDNVLVLARRNQTRILSSIQRIGPDLEPVVVTLDTSGHVRIAGTERDLDDAALGERILAAMVAHGEPISELWLKETDTVEGATAFKVRVLRTLVASGRVRRTGSGGKADPYRYAVSGSPDHSPDADLGSGSQGRKPTNPIPASAPNRSGSGFQVRTTCCEPANLKTVSSSSATSAGGLSGSQGFASPRTREQSANLNPRGCDE